MKNSFRINPVEGGCLNLTKKGKYTRLNILPNLISSKKSYFANYKNIACNQYRNSKSKLN